MKKPDYIKPDVQGIPPELVELPQFVCWRAKFERENNKWTKIPVNPHTGGLASSTDPATWADLSTALKFYQGNPNTVDGLGFVFRAGGGIVGIDFDHCANGSPGSIDVDVLKAIAELGSYAERSVSGTGAHVLCFGELPIGAKGNKRGDFPKKGMGFEIYEKGRFFTLTGAHLDGTPIFIRNAQEAVNRLHSRAFPKKETKTPHPGKQTVKSLLSDAEVLSKIRVSKGAERFSALFDRGDLGDHPTQSEADFELCCILAFWTGGDLEQMDRLFRKSKLMRDKWDREDYRRTTFENCMAGRTEFYKPRKGPEPQPEPERTREKPEEDEGERESIKEEAGASEKKNPWKNAVVSFQELREMPLPKRQALLYPWLLEKTISLVYSWRGMGKTWLAFGLMNALTKAANFGPWTCEEAVPCLYLDGEMPLKMLQERAEEMDIGGPETKAPAKLISREFALELGLPAENLLNLAWREQLTEILVSGGYKVFIVDNLSSLTPGLDENPKEKFDPINQWFLDLRFRGISTIPLHHAGKSGTQRGNSGREDNIDNSIVLKRPGDYEVTDGCRFICTFEKDRCAEGRELLVDHEFTYKGGLWTFSNIKTRAMEQVLREVDKEKTQKEIAEALSLTPGRVSQIIKQAKQKGFISKEGKLTQSGFFEILGKEP